MHVCRPIDRSNHRHLDVEQVPKQTFPLPIDLVPAARSSELAAKAGKVDLGAKRIARAGQNDDLIVWVSTDVSTGIGQFSVDTLVPQQRTAFIMQGDLKNTVTPLHLDGLVFHRILFKASHKSPPF